MSLDVFTVRIGFGLEMLVAAEDNWTAAKMMRQLSRQGYLKRGRFTKSMKPLYFEGMIQMKPGISLEEYTPSETSCQVCGEKMLKLDPPYIGARLVHCSECAMTFIMRRPDDEA